jgi:RND superfamily putative drug exporter
MLAHLGRFAARQRRAILFAWAAVAVAGAVFGGAVYDRTQSVDGLRPDAESTIARERLDRLAPRGELIVAVIAGRNFHATELVPRG